MTDMRRMQVGQIVDFCIEYNERAEQLEKARKKKAKGQEKRKATQADIKAFFG